MSQPFQGSFLTAFGLLLLLPLGNGLGERSIWFAEAAESPPFLSSANQLFASVELSRPDTVAAGTVISIDGSDDMIVVNDRLKQSFETDYPDTSIDLEANGSQVALDKLTQGDIDLAAIGRQLTTEERDRGIVQVTLKREKIAVIIGAGNPFDGDLTLTQFADIFRGKITDWSEVGGEPGPIRFIDRPEDSDVRLALREYGAFKAAPFASGANAVRTSIDDTNAVIAELGQDGISYATTSHVLNLDAVRLVSMHNVLPTNPNYPYSQPRAYAYMVQPSEAAAAFLGYAASPDGRGAIQTALNAEAEAIASGQLIATAVDSANSQRDDTSQISNGDDDSTQTSTNGIDDTSDGQASSGLSETDSSSEDSSGEPSPPSETAIDTPSQQAGASEDESSLGDGNSLETPLNGSDGLGQDSGGGDSGQETDIAAEPALEEPNSPEPLPDSGSTDGTDNLPQQLPMWFWWLLPVVVLALLLWKRFGQKTASQPDESTLEEAIVPSPSEPELAVDASPMAEPELVADADPIAEFSNEQDGESDQPDSGAQSADDFLYSLPEDDSGVTLEQETVADLSPVDVLLATMAESTSQNPNGVDAWIARGHALVDVQQYEEAAASFEHALNLVPDSAAALAGKGRLALAMNRPEEARAHFDAASLQHPDDATLALYQGHVLAQLEQFDAALMAYNRSAMIDPNLVEATLGKGNTLSTVGQFEDAIVCFNHVLDRVPGASDLGIDATASAISKDAMASLGLPLLSSISLKAQALSGRGLALLSHGYTGAALDNLRQAVEADPNAPGLWVSLGDVLVTLQQTEEAIACFDKALALDPEHPGAIASKLSVQTNAVEYEYNDYGF